jgi:hypothetical protein
MKRNPVRPFLVAEFLQLGRADPHAPSDANTGQAPARHQPPDGAGRNAEGPGDLRDGHKVRAVVGVHGRVAYRSATRSGRLRQDAFRHPAGQRGDGARAWVSGRLGVKTPLGGCDSSHAAKMTADEQPADSKTRSET